MRTMMQRLRKAATKRHPGLKASGSVVEEEVCSDESRLRVEGRFGVGWVGEMVVSEEGGFSEEVAILTEWMGSKVGSVGS